MAKPDDIGDDAFQEAETLVERRLSTPIRNLNFIHSTISPHENQICSCRVSHYAGRRRKDMNTDRNHVWDDLIDDEIRHIYSNYAARSGLRTRPALLCIDNYNGAFGDRPEPVVESMKRFPSSCGLAAWRAVEPTGRLMVAARQAGIPVIHTTSDDSNRSSSSPMYSTKRTSYHSDQFWAHSFFPALQPMDDELIIHKPRSSAFYGTSLASHLVQMDVNTLIVCGNTTSGCVRASVMEAYMQGYSIAVVEECVFDRSWLSHKVNLFDINAKYGDVMFLDEVLGYLRSLPHQHTESTQLSTASF